MNAAVTAQFPFDPLRVGTSFAALLGCAVRHWKRALTSTLQLWTSGAAALIGCDRFGPLHQSHNIYI